MEVEMEKDDTEKEHNPHIDEVRQHMRAARSAMRKSYEEILPKGFVENRRTARKEFLLAIRSILDAAIEHSEKGS
jgi:hypothetical protein